MTNKVRIVVMEYKQLDTGTVVSTYVIYNPQALSARALRLINYMGTMVSVFNHSNVYFDNTLVSSNYL